MQLLTHLDPAVLEQSLLDRVDAAHPREGLGQTLVIVPTTRLAAHLKRRLAGLRGAWLGLEIVDFRSLAFRILDSSRAPAVEIVSDHLVREALRHVLATLPENGWSRFADRRPGTVQALESTLRDLREAGIEPDALGPLVDDGDRARELAEIYREFCRTLDRSAANGWVDGAGLIRAATPHASAFAGRHGAIFLHGAYELIGTHLDLLREIDRSVGVTALVPLASGASVSSFAESFARDFLLEPGTEPRAIDSRSAEGLPLEMLYDESGRPEPAAPDRFHFRHTQGAAAEVGIALAEALSAIRGGCPPTEIAITARSLEPYASALEEAFDDAGLPWTSSLHSPLRRHPAVRDFLLLLQVVADNFPRQITAELLRSPRIRWTSLLPGRRPPNGPRAEIWSRKARLIGGLEEWTDHLPRWAAQPNLYPGQGEEERAEAEQSAVERAAAAREIGSGLAALAQSVSPEARRWGDHAGRSRKLLGSLFFTDDDPRAIAAIEALDGLLVEMGRIEPSVGDDRRVPFAEMVRWLGEAVDRTELALHRGDGGGIRVLDAMQLRGLTFRHVHLLGMNSGLFPRPPREDPILPDRLRLRLREATGRPLTIKSRGIGEERLLLALLIGAGKERIEVSWQRADEAGRAKTASLALREIARLAFGSPDGERLRSSARHLRSHPQQWLQDLVERPGLISPEAEIVMEALQPRSAARLEKRFPHLGAGLEMLRATQSFNDSNSIYDARVGPRQLASELSVSAIEVLGRCPLQFFFARVLRVRELDDPANALEIPPFELGNQVHDLLERLYRRLNEENLFKAESAEPLVERALELLDAEPERILGDIGGALRRRVPVLYEQLTEDWQSALQDFLRDDLPILHARGAVPTGLEELKLVELNFGDGCTEWVKGRFDRVAEGAPGVVVSDYKTSGNLDRRIAPITMLKGATLQVPLYWMLAGGEARLELLGVGPAFDPDEYRFRFDGFDGKIAEGFKETVRILLGLRHEGTYPFNDGTHCSWCPYDEACRRNHPPTVDREQNSGDSDLFRMIHDKNTRKPTITDVIQGKR